VLKHQRRALQEAGFTLNPNLNPKQLPSEQCFRFCCRRGCAAPQVLQGMQGMSAPKEAELPAPPPPDPKPGFDTMLLRFGNPTQQPVDAALESVVQRLEDQGWQDDNKAMEQVRGLYGPRADGWLQLAPGTHAYFVLAYEGGCKRKR